MLDRVGSAQTEMFDARLRRWWPDLSCALAEIYPPQEIAELEADVAEIIARAFARRPAALRRRDLDRLVRPDWFQDPGMLGYAAYTDRFSGTLSALRGRVSYLSELGVQYLHLMPLLTPRPDPNDGGYAVADYRSIRSDLGTVADLADLAADLHRSGISLCVDLVLNHVAREHEWARRARAGDSRYRRAFHVFGDRTVPEEFERTLPEVFPDFAPGNFTFDPDLNGWVWTTFNSWQWDVNWSNSDVFCAYLDIMCFLANVGVDVLRLDAIAFLWKRLGTSSQNQPEVHAIVQALRAAMRIVAPSVLFKAEAIVGPDDLITYLGQGERQGKVSDLAYHNALMVHVWSMLATRDSRLATHALSRFPPAPSSTAWITYVRCHDDIGWAIDDADAAAVGLHGPSHRSFLSDFYSGIHPGSFGRGLVFQHNPETDDRRISGSCASLAGLDAALELPPGAARDREVDLAVARILLVHAIVFAWGGIPVLWSGDELGLRNDPAWADDPVHAADNRWAHRPALPWVPSVLGERAAQRVDPSTVAGSVFGGLRHLARVRARLPQLHAATPFEVLQPPHPGVFAVLRRHTQGDLLAMFNVTEHVVEVAADWLDALHASADFDARQGIDELSWAAMTLDPAGALWLPPYAARWVRVPPAPR